MLALVALVHYGYDPIATLLPGVSPAALFYVLRGVEGAILFAVVLTQASSLPLALVAGWGMIEEFQTAACRLSADMGTAPAVVAFSGLCGPWAYALGIVVIAALAAVVAREASDV